MPSPFPGMNPYFEQAGVWRDFHGEFLTALRRQLAPTIGPNYFIQFDEHAYIHELPPEPRRLLGRPDLSISPAGTRKAERPALGVLEAPAEVQLSALDVERVPFLEVRDRLDREVITIIELLSPSNKRPGPDREQYLARRREIFRSATNLVEIDLLRGWAPMPSDGRPSGDYSVLVSRAVRRPAAAFWPIGFRDRLPIIPIPLKPDDPEGRVDLQDVMHQAHDGPGYENFIYLGTPEPPLSAEDAEWATRFAPKRD